MVINIIGTYILIIVKEGITMTINISKRESELVVSFDYSQERITKVKSINGIQMIRYGLYHLQKVIY